jgi:hypothetical protein
MCDPPGSTRYRHRPLPDERLVADLHQQESALAECATLYSVPLHVGPGDSGRQRQHMPYGYAGMLTLRLLRRQRFCLQPPSLSYQRAQPFRSQRECLQLWGKSIGVSLGPLQWFYADSVNRWTGAVKVWPTLWYSTPPGRCLAMCNAATRYPSARVGKLKIWSTKVSTSQCARSPI